MTGRLDVATWLSLAAAPTFAIMALVTGVQEARQDAVLCSVLPAGSPVGAMAAMYLLMSAFHLPPWLRLAASRGGRIKKPSLAARRPQA